MSRRLDLTGQVFGRLTVQAQASTTQDGRTRWLCRCSCPTQSLVIVQRGNLRSGHTTSCGCFHRERFLPRTHRIVHGFCRNGQSHGWYAVWVAMWQRCTNPRNSAFKNYGARGITVVARWRDPQVFYTDVGERPTSAHTLERRDNQGDYTPENCYWATRLQQARNTRTNRLLTHAGITLCVAAWAERLAVPKSTLYTRLWRGWPLSRVLQRVQ